MENLADMGKRKRRMKKEEKILHSSFVRTPKVLEELDMLFDMSPPSYLKKSITELFFSYLCNTEQEDYKPEMKEIATDFYFLIKFLEVAEIYEKEIKTSSP